MNGAHAGRHPVGAGKHKFRPVPQQIDRSVPAPALNE